ncbi:MAG: orotate phosphoribosyltransferase [Armatimonadota bacterium]|nr:orotate phosphoribosyltransferase [Armatimonadota bacterium]MDR5702213.1 orotate phosphoribosyltransferase [Armatimonadota bacterium]MDR7435910.1 orotate phosphoribosyltransferase [Armatimonadota bacterium]
MDLTALVKVMERTGVFQEGHFLLSSGMHSARYLQCALLLQHPDLAQQVCAALAQRFAGEEIQVVLGAALGGIIVAHETARALGARALFAEREEGKLVLRRGFTISPQERVLLVEDVITTGGTVRELNSLVEEAGGEVVGVGAIVDRSAGRAILPGRRLEALLTLEIETYPPEECPLCQKGIPWVKPGSRIRG